MRVRAPFPPLSQPRAIALLVMERAIAFFGMEMAIAKRGFFIEKAIFQQARALFINE